MEIVPAQDEDAGTVRTVVAEGSVLRSLITVDGLGWLSALPGYRFVMAEQAWWAAGAPALEAAKLEVVPLVDSAGLAVFASLIRIMGRGEAGSLALASAHGWDLASDTAGLFRREAVSRLGGERILTTVALTEMARRARLVSGFE